MIGRRLRQGLTILVLGALPLLLLEGGLRLAGWPTGRVRTFGKLLNFDADSRKSAIGMFHPSSEATVMWPIELAYRVHINSLGLRGSEIQREPPPGVKRVLALGDSMTFGFYLDEDETWTARLQALLRQRGAAVEVVNAGVGGWSIDSETSFALERGLALEPDYVLVGFCKNDPEDLIRSPGRYDRMQRSLGSARGRFSVWVYGSASYELYLTLQLRWKRWLRGISPNGAQRAAGLGPEESASAWKSYGEWIDRLHAALLERDIPLALVYLPNPEDVAASGRPELETRLRRLASQRGLLFVSPLDAFRADPVPGLHHMPRDPHLGVEGARRVAQVLADALAPSLIRRAGGGPAAR